VRSAQTGGENVRTCWRARCTATRPEQAPHGRFTGGKQAVAGLFSTRTYSGEDRDRGKGLGRVEGVPVHFFFFFFPILTFFLLLPFILRLLFAVYSSSSLFFPPYLIRFFIFFFFFFFSSRTTRGSAADTVARPPVGEFAFAVVVYSPPRWPGSPSDRRTWRTRRTGNGGAPADVGGNTADTGLASASGRGPHGNQAGHATGATREWRCELAHLLDPHDILSSGARSGVAST